MSNSSKITKILREDSTPVSATVPVVKPAFAPVAASLETPFEAASAPRSRRWMWVGAGVAALLVVAGGGAFGAYSNWKSQEKIAPGVMVQGVPVGGLTMGEARGRLVKKFGATQVAFQTPKATYRVPLAKMGGKIQFERALQNAYWFGRSGALPTNVWKVWGSRATPQRLPLAIAWDKPQLRREMNAIAQKFEDKAVPARLAMGEAGLQVVPDVPGQTINSGATLTTLQKQFFVGDFKPVKATLKTIYADLRAADLVGRDVELGRYTTFFDSGLWGRTRNIIVSAAAIDGRVLMPGEEFSFNKCTGERTWDKGYRMAKMFERKPGKSESEVVDGLAGGICQVSTTAYNAVRKANNKMVTNLKITERNYHSLPVTYVSSGMDATVAWPSKDFRFANSLEFPIYLRAFVEGSRLRVVVMGRVPEGAPSPFENANEETSSRRQAFNF